MKVLLLSTLVLVISNWHVAPMKMTSPKIYFRALCGEGQALTYMYSVYKIDKQDRQFYFSCKTSKLITKQCIWTGFLNEYEKDLHYKCPKGYVISGIASLYSYSKRDRRFRISCCKLLCDARAHCYESVIANSPQAIMNYRTPCGFYISEIHNVFDGDKKDRVWQFKECNITDDRWNS